MKTDALRHIIREEVRAAIKAEVQDMLIEAVRIASAPDTKVQQPQHRKLTGTGTPIRPGNVPLGKLMEETARSLRSEDIGVFVPEGDGEEIVDTRRQPGVNITKTQAVAARMGMLSEEVSEGEVDISKLGFLKKAKQILDLSYEKDKTRNQ